MAATGTDCIIHKQTLAHHLPTEGDGTVRIHALTGGTSGSDSEMSMGSEVPGNEVRGGCVRTGAGRRTERGGFEPPKPVSQFNGLANPFTCASPPSVQEGTEPGSTGQLPRIQAGPVLTRMDLPTRPSGQEWATEAEPVTFGSASATENAPSLLPADPELASIIDAWETLPEAVRAGIVAMVKAASPKGCRG
jgi:hypothetical protein